MVKLWLWLRLFYVIASFVGCLFMPPSGILDRNPWLFIAFSASAIIFMPIMLIFVIGIQAINPLSGEKWTKPNWTSMLLNFRDPLHFFHLGGFCAIAGGTGVLFASLYRQRFDVAALILLGCGFSTLLGIRLCIRIFKKKFS